MPAEALESRIVGALSLALLPFALLATLLAPSWQGFHPVDIGTGLAVSLGLGVAHVLARWGLRRASSGVLLAAMAAGLSAMAIRNAGEPAEDLYVAAMLVPVSVAFTLRHIILGAVGAGATVAYIAWRAAAGTLEEPFAVAGVFLGGAAATAIGPILREKERRRAVVAETALLEAQAIAHIGNWELDLHSGQGTWSREMYNLFGRDRATFRPTYSSSFESIHPDDRLAVDREFRACMEQHRDLDIDHRILLADGTVRHVNERARFAYGPDGRPVRASGTTQDITQRRRAEEAREEAARHEAEVRRLDDLARLRMDFLNTAAHDLRTPLTPLRLQLATLRTRGGLTAAQAQDLDLVERNVARLQVLVDDMLDAAQLQSGQLRLRRETVPLGRLVEEATLAFQEPARQRNLHLELVPPPPVHVDADPAKSLQVLMNLVSNAVKYTPPGGRVKVRVEEAKAEGIVAVEDTGLGLAPEQMERLFQPFTRLHEGTPGTPKGTGLGLYISKGIMEQHGGRMWVESPGPGRGAAFMAAWPTARRQT